MSDSTESWQHGPGLLESIWRLRYVVTVVTLLAAAAGYAISSSSEATYQTSAELFLADPRVGVFDVNDRIVIAEYVAQQAARADSGPVMERAAAQLTELTTRELQAATEVTAQPDVVSLIVSATAGSPEQAAEIANVVTDSYVAMSREQAEERAQSGIESLAEARASLQAEIDAAQEELNATPDDFVVQTRVETLAARLTDLEARAQQLAVDAAVSGSGVDQVLEADPPSNPSGPQPLRDAALLGLLALGLAGAFAYWWGGRDQRVDDRSLPAGILDAPLLGEVPEYTPVKGGTMAARVAVGAAAAESYQFIIASIEFALSSRQGKSFVVSSPQAGDGKTSTAIQLAVAMGREGRDVLLIDGDVRVQGLSRTFGAEDRHGFADVAAGTLNADAAKVRLRLSDNLMLTVIPAGRRPSDPTSLLRSDGALAAMNTLSSDREVTIVDTSPMLAVADASAISSYVDGIVIVVNRGTPVALLEKLRERLSFVNTPIIGYIYNRTKEDKASAYGYGSRGDGTSWRSWGNGPKGALKEESSSRVAARLSSE